MGKNIHGHSKRQEVSSTYSSWFNMKQRCNNPAHSRATSYSGRGITYQDSWENFENFLADMGESPGGRQLDRIDNNGNYTKENCRWVTATEQQQNRSNTLGERKVRLIKALLRSVRSTVGITYARKIIAMQFNVSHSTITYIDRGITWSNIA